MKKMKNMQKTAEIPTNRSGRRSVNIAETGHELAVIETNQILNDPNESELATKTPGKSYRLVRRMISVSGI